MTKQNKNRKKQATLEQMATRCQRNFNIHQFWHFKVHHLPSQLKFSDSFGFERKAIDAYTAVLEYNEFPDFYSGELDDIRNYLFAFLWNIYQNALKYKNY
ncbi:MAG: hypothetical protein PHY48_17090 [Candidatus Cloacimonetes bacterium]|nr:hypothetical protein [Candidatus Cloacimonadota bacterium]